MNNEIVGVIQGTIKIVTLHISTKNQLAKAGYILGLRVAPLHRRKGIALSLVHHMEEWFISHQVDYAYMATEKDNEASVELFVNKLGYVKFRTPAILVHPVNNNRPFHLSSRIEIMKLKIEQAELLYRNFMSSTEFFPHDIDRILRNKLSLGTWVAYFRGRQESSTGAFGLTGKVPNSWAMMSVWNSTEVLKLRVGKPTFSCMCYAKSSSMIPRCFKGMILPSLPDHFFENPFGFYFIYGIYMEGPSSGRLVRTLSKFVLNLATESDCKVVVTEVGGCDDALKLHIPHWKLLSCPEDLWCIKALKLYEDTKKTTLVDNNNNLAKTTPSQKTRALFVDPREV